MKKIKEFFAELARRRSALMDRSDFLAFIFVFINGSAGIILFSLVGWWLFNLMALHNVLGLLELVFLFCFLAGAFAIILVLGLAIEALILGRRRL